MLLRSSYQFEPAYTGKDSRLGNSLGNLDASTRLPGSLATSPSAPNHTVSSASARPLIGAERTSNMSTSSTAHLQDLPMELFSLFLRHMHEIDFPMSTDAFRARFLLTDVQHPHWIHPSLRCAVYAAASHFARLSRPPSSLERMPPPGFFVSKAEEALTNYSSQLRRSNGTLFDILLAMVILGRVALLMGSVADAERHASVACRLAVESGYHVFVVNGNLAADADLDLNGRLWMSVAILSEDIERYYDSGSNQSASSSTSPPSPSLASLLRSRETSRTPGPSNPSAIFPSMQEHYVASSLNARARAVAKHVPPFLTQSTRERTGCTLTADVAEEYGAILGAVNVFKQTLTPIEDLQFDASPLINADTPALTAVHATLNAHALALSGTLILAANIAGYGLLSPSFPAFLLQQDGKTRRAAEHARVMMRRTAFEISSLVTKLDEFRFLLVTSSAGAPANNTAGSLLCPDVGYAAALSMRALILDTAQMDAEEDEDSAAGDHPDTEFRLSPTMVNNSHLDVLWTHLVSSSETCLSLMTEVERIRDMLST